MDPVPPSPEHVVFIEGAASLRATTHRKRGERVSSQSEPSDADCPKDHRASLDGGSRWPRSFLRRRRIRACALVAAALLLVLHLLLCCVLAAREHALRWEPRPHSVAAGSSPHVVPKIIHQMYKTADLPAKWADVPGAWAALHPPPEYQYVLWTDATLRELIAREYAWLLPTYDAYPHPTQRWDASRYAVLHRYGGLYVDLDVHPVRPVDELLRGQTLLLPYTPNIGLTNAIVAATPGHPFLSFALRELPTYARRWYHVTRHFEVLTSTGSHSFGPCTCAGHACMRARSRRRSSLRPTGVSARIARRVALRTPPPPPSLQPLPSPALAARQLSGPRHHAISGGFHPAPPRMAAALTPPLPVGSLHWPMARAPPGTRPTRRSCCSPSATRTRSWPSPSSCSRGDGQAATAGRRSSVSQCSSPSAYSTPSVSYSSRPSSVGPLCGSS